MAGVAGPLAAGMVTGSAASCRYRPARPGAGSARRRRCPGWTGPGARAGCARRDVPARAKAGHDLAQLGVQGPGRQPAAVHVPPQRAEPAGLRLPPVVDDDLVHHVEQVKLDGGDRAVRNNERAGPDRAGAQQRLGRGQPGGLDQDVGAVERLVRGNGDPHRGAG